VSVAQGEIQNLREWCDVLEQAQCTRVLRFTAYDVRVLLNALDEALKAPRISYETQAVQEAYEPAQGEWHPTKAELADLAYRCEKQEGEGLAGWAPAPASDPRRLNSLAVDLKRVAQERDAVAAERDKLAEDLQVADENLVSARVTRDTSIAHQKKQLARIFDVEADRDKWRDAHAELVKELTRVTAELADAWRVCEVTKSERNAAQHEREVLQHELDDLSEESEQRGERLDLLREDRDKYRSEAQKLTEALAAGHAEVERLKAELADANADTLAVIEQSNNALSEALAESARVTVSGEAARAVLEYLDKLQASKPKQWEPQYVMGPAVAPGVYEAFNPSGSR
jgi:chromosome segregation ATPase